MKSEPKMLLPITVFIAAKNEEVNLRKCLRSLESFERVVVLDSNSDDNSSSVVAEHNRELVQFEYSGGYPKKRQWALDNVPIASAWVLFLDADEEMTSELEAEIADAISRPTFDAFLITKGFHFMGQKFRYGGFSHAALLLFKVGAARFEQLDIVETSGMDMEVHERLNVNGSTGRLKNPLIHDDFKDLQAYIDRHNKYSTWEAAVREKLFSGSLGETEVQPRIFGDVQQRRRWLKLFAMRIPGEHWLWFAYHFIFRLGFLEGRRGLIASQIRSQYIANVRAKLFERKISR